jgi:hypothetical protein
MYTQNIYYNLQVVPGNLLCVMIEQTKSLKSYHDVGNFNAPILLTTHCAKYITKSDVKENLCACYVFNGLILYREI